jgi:dCTP deaminase
MLLNDSAIRRYIDEQSIKIEPDITDEQIQPASLDVRMGEEAYAPESDTKLGGDMIAIDPGQFLLGTTLDRIEMPSFLAAQLTGRSSIGRKGVIVHATAGWIDPGFNGQITLEMFNMSHETVWFEPGDRVAQLVFFPLTAPALEPYDGQYQDQVGVEQ